MKGKGAYIALVLILAGLIVLARLTPDKVVWVPTFDSKDKIPYGSFILYKRLKDIFPHGRIETADYSFYNFMERGEDSGASYLIVTGDLNASDLDVRRMTAFAAAGNNVFIAADHIPQLLADTLGIEIKEEMDILSADSTGYLTRLADSNYSKDTFRIKDEAVARWIKDADPRANLLGEEMDAPRQSVVARPRLTLGLDLHGRANFAKIPFGQGAFLIHLIPLTFTNYNMLKRNNNEYVAACLSRLPDGDIYWDQFYKPYHRDRASSPFRFIVSVPAYRWALYLAIVSAIMYMVFAGKRLQRIIPILQPPANLSLKFTRTVGTLYYQQKDHRDIAIKKMTYLLQRIRQYYMLPTGDTGSIFRSRLAYKSNVDIETINDVFDIFDRDIIRVRHITEGVLIEFNTALEKFYNDSGLINK